MGNQAAQASSQGVARCRTYLVSSCEGATQAANCRYRGNGRAWLHDTFERAAAAGREPTRSFRAWPTVIGDGYRRQLSAKVVGDAYWCRFHVQASKFAV